MFSQVVVPTCIGCKKTPDEIQEYVYCAKEEGTSPIRFVITDEGTYNRFEKDKFYCTECYVKAGCPTRVVKRW